MNAEQAAPGANSTQSARRTPSFPLIHTENLSRTYRVGNTGVRALKSVSIDVDKGEFVAVTGPSGSGKSTLMHILGCLEKPSGGSYLFSGRDVSAVSDADLARLRGRDIGFVFQSYNLINQLTVLENVALAPFYLRDHTSEARERCEHAVEIVGLAGRIRHRPSELSGGEMQRVAIARALANDPLLLLADEPTGNLDTETGGEILKLFHLLNEQGRTILIVSHDPAVAKQCGRRIHLVDGNVVEEM